MKQVDLSRLTSLVLAFATLPLEGDIKSRIKKRSTCGKSSKFPVKIDLVTYRICIGKLKSVTLAFKYNLYFKMDYVVSRNGKVKKVQGYIKGHVNKFVYCD